MKNGETKLTLLIRLVFKKTCFVSCIIGKNLLGNKSLGNNLLATDFTPILEAEFLVLWIFNKEEKGSNLKQNNITTFYKSVYLTDYIYNTIIKVVIFFHNLITV